MTIFDCVQSILFTKDRGVLTSADDEGILQPYMLNRWISMHSGEMAGIVNQTTNKYSQVFVDKQELFNFYITIFPKLRYKRLDYIKKSKEKVVVDELLPRIAKTQECSVREIKLKKELVELFTNVDKH